MTSDQQPRRHGAIGLTLRFLWRWSLYVTVPIVAVFCVWLFRAGTKYQNLGLGYQTLGDEVNLRSILDFEGRTLLRDVGLAITPKSERPKRTLRHLELFLKSGAETKLDADLPFSGREYVKASLVFPDGKVRDVRVRYRGDHFWHWAGRKKSIRVKTRKGELFNGMRSFNVIAPKLPEQISGHLSYFVARQFDLITPRAEMVDLYVNGEYRGVHLFLEQLEEMIVRKHDRMPGDIYAADIVGRDRYRSIPSKIFKNAGLWEKIAVNNHFDEDSNEPIQELIRVLGRPPSEARSLDLRKLVNIDAFARFAAFRIICQSEHYDNAHNWRIYYDPWKNQFEPIVWDPVGWAIGWRPKHNRRSQPDIATSLLDQVLMEDHAYLEARQQAIEGFYSSGGDEALLAELDRVAQEIAPSLESDPGLAQKIYYMSSGQVEQATLIFRYFVQLILSQTREDYLGDSTLSIVEGSTGPGCLRIEVDGRRPLLGLTVRLASPPGASIDALLRFQDRTGKVRERDLSGVLTQAGAEIHVETFFAGQLEADPRRPAIGVLSAGRLPGRGVYELELHSVSPEHALPTIQGVHGTYASGEHVHGLWVDEIYPAAFTTVSAVAVDEPIRKPTVWEGEHRIEGVQTIHDDVILRPGTRLAMAPDASLIFEGRVLALGTQEQPIIVEPADPSDGAGPWGTFALRGEGANGSTIQHMRFKLGSGLKTPLAEYSAMFSIHNVQDITISHCDFRDSRVVDDMVHAVYSTVAFDTCVFTRSLADALDLDITQGTVKRCAFVASGNDALDLMTAQIVMEDTWITASGDKGISVGEDTDLLVVNSSIKDCLIGMQAKDRSRAVAYNCELTGNDKAVDAYQKNWRYGAGGTAFIYKSLFSGNKETILADKHSMIRIHDCLFDERVIRGDSIFIDRTSQVRGKRAAAYRDFRRFPQDEAQDAPVLSSAVQAAWQSVDPQIRGLKPKQ